MDAPAFASLSTSFLAAIVALLALYRTMVQQTPAVEFLGDDDGSGADGHYRISVSNPTHRMLVLAYVEVRSPDPSRVFLRPMDISLRADLERSWETVRRKDGKIAVFLEVPARATRCLEARVDVQDPDIDFRLHWSKTLKALLRVDGCLTRGANRIKLDECEVRYRQLAAASRVSDAGASEQE